MSATHGNCKRISNKLLHKMDIPSTLWRLSTRTKMEVACRNYLNANKKVGWCYTLLMALLYRNSLFKKIAFSCAYFCTEALKYLFYYPSRTCVQKNVRFKLRISILVVLILCCSLRSNKPFNKQTMEIENIICYTDKYIYDSIWKWIRKSFDLDFTNNW